MKKFSFLLFATVIVLCACNSNEKIMLLNENDLDNWIIVLPDSTDQSSVFKIENKILYVSGIPNGYIRTKDSYSSYKLHVEWRWPDKPANSGVFLHASRDNIIWPNCFEAQLKSGKAGDFILMGKGVGLTVNGTHLEIKPGEKKSKSFPKLKDSSEKAPGEWNSYDITVSEESIELRVNGVLQNLGKNPSKTHGSICLQSEGGPIEFRNVYLVEKN